MKLFSEETLSHYGIPGMKHGVRRWQYEDGRFNEEGKIRYFGYPKRKKNINPISDIDKDNKELLNKILIGAAITAGVVGGSYLLYRYHDDLMRFNSEKIDPTTGFRLLNKKESLVESMHHTNPAYNDLTMGHKMNCMLCTTNMELRQRGYDSYAGYSLNGFHEGALFPKIFKDIKPTDVKEIKINSSNINEKIASITNAFANEPNGSRGNFMYSWDMGPLGKGAHSIMYSKENGIIKFFDGQRNKELSIKEVAKYIPKSSNDYDFFSRPSITFLRTDNKEINFDALKKYNLIESSPIKFYRRLFDIDGLKYDILEKFDFNGRYSLDNNFSNELINQLNNGG